MDRRPLLLLLLDACRFDYVEARRMPFLARAARQGLYVRRLRPGFGFCEIAELLTGAPASVTGLFCQLGKRARPARGPAARAARLAAPLEERGGAFLHEALRSLLRRLHRRAREGEIYRVPARLLPWFGPTEGARGYDEPGAFGVESLFDVLRRHGLRWDARDFVAQGRIEGADRERARRLAARAARAPALVLGYLGALDAAGHRFGPAGPELAAELRLTDRRLCRITEAFLRCGANVLIVGDHGMLAVEESADALAAHAAACRKLGLADGRDVLAFCDSTLFRVWFRRRELAADYAAAFERGLGLDEQRPRAPGWPGEREPRGPAFRLAGEAARALGAPEGDPRYGDLIYAARPGVVFHPDYFCSAVPRGMHGYRTDLPGQQGFLLGLGPDFPQVLVAAGELTDAAATAAAVLGLPRPGECRGRDLRAGALLRV